MPQSGSGSQWLSVDPMAEKYRGWSPYCYAKNNALTLVDPDGRRVYYHDERLRLVYNDMASKSLEFRLILQMYSQNDGNTSRSGGTPGRRPSAQESHRG